MNSVDCRGLNCPEPVLQTKKALADNPDRSINVLVDNETARENVLRFARNQGRIAMWQKEGNDYMVAISAGSDYTGQETPEEQPLLADESTENPVIFIATDEMGVGSRELGTMLMRNFIYTLTKREVLPKALVFMNSGVKLSIANSPAIEELEELEQKGVHILVCGTCLDYYELKEKHKVGLVSNMYDIADLLLEAERVVTI